MIWFTYLQLILLLFFKSSVYDYAFCFCVSDFYIVKIYNKLIKNTFTDKF